MPMWRCPHCSTPQAEAARCWVCHRSSSSCASCRNYRRSITAGVAYCALDRGRKALNGQEIRPCWEPVITLTGAAGAAGAPGPAAEAGDPELISVETLLSSELESGRFWRDAER
ncbi:MAG TPA: hypothetical protein VKR24_05320 [Candidatus Limnocylindrales bacterium]|nr:hypothetical protein [Candidatus Limnocylindrales bacterium]